MNISAKDTAAAARPRCVELTRAGRPCTQPARGSDGRCFYHSNDPVIVAQRAAGRVTGGRVVSQMRTAALVGSLRSPREILLRIEELLHRLAAAELSPKAINAACRLLAEAREAIALEARLRREERDDERRRFRTYALAPEVVERIIEQAEPDLPRRVGLAEFIEPTAVGDDADARGNNTD